MYTQYFNRQNTRTYVTTAIGINYNQSTTLSLARSYLPRLATTSSTFFSAIYLLVQRKLKNKTQEQTKRNYRLVGLLAPSMARWIWRQQIWETESARSIIAIAFYHHRLFKAYVFTYIGNNVRRWIGKFLFIFLVLIERWRHCKNGFYPHTKQSPLLLFR